MGQITRLPPQQRWRWKKKRSIKMYFIRI
jgi:hypothetical protein